MFNVPFITTRLNALLAAIALAAVTALLAGGGGYILGHGVAKADGDAALAKLINEVPESLAFVLSDFMYPLDFRYSFHRTAHGTDKHEVKAIQVLEECEIELPPHSKGVLPLYDYENGRTVALDMGKWKAYNAAMSRLRLATKERLNRAGIAGGSNS